MTRDYACAVARKLVYSTGASMGVVETPEGVYRIVFRPPENDASVVERFPAPSHEPKHGRFEIAAAEGPEK